MNKIKEWAENGFPPINLNECSKDIIDLLNEIRYLKILREAPKDKKKPDEIKFLKNISFPEYIDEEEKQCIIGIMHAYNFTMGQVRQDFRRVEKDGWVYFTFLKKKVSFEYKKTGKNILIKII